MSGNANYSRIMRFRNSRVAKFFAKAFEGGWCTKLQSFDDTNKFKKFKKK